MFKFKALVLATVLATPMLASAAQYTFVGSWQVDQGPSWRTNPPVYSGQEAAALLFGGSFIDYAISIDANPANVTHTAWYDGWGVHDSSGTGVDNIFADNFHKDTGGAGYDSAPGTGSAFSSYVSDGLFGTKYTNYAYRVAAVPEPQTYALMGLGLVAVALARRRNKTVA